MVNKFEQSDTEHKLLPAINNKPMKAVKNDSPELAEFSIMNVTETGVDYGTVKMSMENTRRQSEVPENSYETKVTMRAVREAGKSQMS